MLLAWGRLWAGLQQGWAGLGKAKVSVSPCRQRKTAFGQLFVREFSVSLCFKGETINWQNRQRVSPLKQGEKQNDDKLIGNDKIGVLC